MYLVFLLLGESFLGKSLNFYMSSLLTLCNSTTSDPHNLLSMTIYLYIIFINKVCSFK